MAKLSNSEQMLYSTVHLEAQGAGGTFDGTGFFYQYQAKNGIVHLVVTNKHVLDGCDVLKLRCHQAASSGGPSGKHFEVRATIGKGAIVEHPDPDVDLCGVSLPIADYARQSGGQVFYVPLDKSLIPTKSEWEEFDAYEEVLMVGCPNGLYDETNNLPIFRRGITASHPAMRYNGSEEFLIDAACFPGSSGSPVFLHNVIGYMEKTTGNYMLGAQRVKLMGILYAGPTIDQEGEIVLAKGVPISVSTMMHLGCVIRSSRLLELEEALERMLERQGI